jgi:hypothetical protein
MLLASVVWDVARYPAGTLVEDEVPLSEPKLDVHIYIHITLGPSACTSTI